MAAAQHQTFLSGVVLSAVHESPQTHPEEVNSDDSSGSWR